MYNSPSSDNFDDVGRFHQKFGLDNTSFHDPGPRELPRDALLFRLKFMVEELQEFATATHFKIAEVGYDTEDIFVMDLDEDENRKIDHAGAFDALIDLVYVAMGTAHLMGYPWELGWRRVQGANMRKIRAKADASDSARGHALDVVKPPGWTPPDIEQLLQQYGWDMNL